MFELKKDCLEMTNVHEKKWMLVHFMDFIIGIIGRRSNNFGPDEKSQKIIWQAMKHLLT